LSGIALAEPLPKPDVVLTDTRGLPFDFRAGTDGKLTLLFFGYTHCPDICPVHMANLAQVISNLSASEASRIRVVFVTTDPARDTPERLKEWLGQFSPSFVGLTGDTATIRRMQEELNVPPAVIESAPTPTGGYSVGHAGYVIAFTPDNLARFVYPFGTRQEDWARDLPRLLAAEWTP
jgi:protein SCO1/2